VCILSVMCVDIEVNVKIVIFVASNERNGNVVSGGRDARGPPEWYPLRVNHLWEVGPRIGGVLAGQPVFSRTYFQLRAVK
jgi:hypothetical protein